MSVWFDILNVPISQRQKNTKSSRISKKRLSKIMDTHKHLKFLCTQSILEISPIDNYLLINYSNSVQNSTIKCSRQKQQQLPGKPYYFNQITWRRIPLLRSMQVTTIKYSINLARLFWCIQALLQLSHFYSQRSRKNKRF